MHLQRRNGDLSMKLITRWKLGHYNCKRRCLYYMLCVQCCSKSFADQDYETSIERGAVEIILSDGKSYDHGTTVPPHRYASQRDRYVDSGSAHSATACTTQLLVNYPHNFKSTPRTTAYCYCYHLYWSNSHSKEHPRKSSRFTSVLQMNSPGEAFYDHWWFW